MASRRLAHAVSSSTTKVAAATDALQQTASLASKRWSSSSGRSTTAMAHKSVRQRRTPLPVADTPPSWSAPSAVSSILHDAPSLTAAPPKRHILNCLVQDGPGVIAQVSGILAARGFNIHSLVGCKTGVEELARITIVLVGQDGIVEQARRQLEDLVPVWAVLDYTEAALVQRELVLTKINVLGPEYFGELLEHHRKITARNTKTSGERTDSDLTLEGASSIFHPGAMVASEALRLKHEHLKSITYLTEQFGGTMVDVSAHSCLVQLTAKPDRIDSFLKLVGPFGILESARTGVTVLPRSTLHQPEENIMMEADEVVDASQLPPG